MASVGIVVNSIGLQERRAAQLAGRASRHQVKWTLVSPTAREVFQLARQVDVVYVIDPGRRGFPAFLAASLAGAACVVEVGDPQATLYRAQGRSLVSVVAGFVIDHWVAWTARGVVVRGRDLVSTFGVRGPWVYLPDGVDLGLFAALDTDRIRAVRDSLNVPEDHLLVGVVGSIAWSEANSWCYGMEIVNALSSLPETVEALIVGDGDGLENLRARAATLGLLERVHLVGRVDHSTVPAYIQAMDICVSTQTDDAVGWGRTTAKLPEYLACDRFVLSTRVGEAARLLPEEMLIPYEGAFDAGYPSRLAGRIALALSRVGELRQSGGTAKIAAAEFDYAMLADRWEAFLDRATRTGKVA